MSTFMNELETEAAEQLKALRAYRTYQGTDSDRRYRARIALGVVGNYVRLRATIANERTNELVATRLERTIDAQPEIKRLTE